ncbi:MAG: hypothetical protein Kow006_02880 [Gammaproteobacteria bacterium]
MAKSPNILILDAHSDAAIACMQSLGRAGYKVCIAGARDTGVAFKSRYPSQRFIYPNPQEDPRIFLAWLETIVADHHFDAVLPVTDATIHPIMGLTDEHLAREKAVLPPHHAYDIAFDKEKTHGLARELGVPVPFSVLVEAEDQIWIEQIHGGFPLYIKPVRSKIWSQGVGHSLAPELVRDEEGFHEALKRFLRYGPVQVQGYVQGRGVGIEVLCDRGEIVLAFAHQRLHEYPLTGGRSTYREAIDMPPDLYDATRRLMLALGWHGVAMVEFKQGPQATALMEINGRLWGSLPLAIAAGVDFPAALLALHLDGRRPEVQPAYRIGRRQRNLGFDLVWMRDNLRVDHQDFCLLTEPIVPSILGWLRVLTPNEGWDHFDWRDPGPGWQQIWQLLRDSSTKLADVTRRALVLRKARSASLKRLNETCAERLLVICYGNIYRSPYVSAKLSQLLEGRVEVRSAGFHPRTGRSCAPDYVALVEEFGVNLREHRSRLVSKVDIDWAELILVMDWRNYIDLRKLAPNSKHKVVWLGSLLDEVVGVEILDPYGQRPEQARRIVEQMSEACEQLAIQLSRRISKDS